jgi:ribonuclease G
VEAFLVQINPRVTAQFTGNQARVLHALEAETGKFFHFEGSERLPLDHFAITMEGTDLEVRERAVPFREGDEVLVQIVEPHMYNVDDAVAKIDGYIISVTNGGPHVGEKRLVRIDDAGRTSARASLIDNGVPDAKPLAAGQEAGSDAEADADALESTPRRRGRRGGRRRSAAKAEVTPSD